MSYFSLLFLLLLWNSMAYAKEFRGFEQVFFQRRSCLRVLVPDGQRRQSKRHPYTSLKPRCPNFVEWASKVFEIS